MTTRRIYNALFSCPLPSTCSAHYFVLAIRDNFDPSRLHNIVVCENLLVYAL
jgi:hypothetical protein